MKNAPLLIETLLDWKVRYIPLLNTIRRWYANRKRPYSALSVSETAGTHKTSETIFILGGGYSILDITDKQWDFIGRHDSIGMNLWPTHWFVPAFWYTNYPRAALHRLYYLACIQRSLRGYQNTVTFVSRNRAMRRGIHPRVAPEFFPVNAKCCFYQYVEPIALAPGQNFRPHHFESTLYYRGGLSLIMDLINKMGYQRIVMMGVDLNRSGHFYDTYPHMDWQFKTGYAPLPSKNGQQGVMGTKGGSKSRLDQYLYAVNEHYFTQHGIELFVGSGESRLAGRLPVFRF